MARQSAGPQLHVEDKLLVAKNRESKHKPSNQTSLLEVLAGFELDVERLFISATYGICCQNVLFIPPLQDRPQQLLSCKIEEQSFLFVYFFFQGRNRHTKQKKVHLIQLQLHTVQGG